MNAIAPRAMPCHTGTYGGDPYLAAFNLMSTSEIAIALRQDPSWSLPTRANNHRVRMAVARKLAARGGEIRHVTPKGNR